ncbi:unnamed protein product [Linum trigynum]|uniref:Single-stranded DNA binding protein Ssb-like OB fold domain-containing protein n=1 Tax=Linum trigynum TaxID=586398 RepID=A0AAV2ECK8_9ROSI
MAESKQELKKPEFIKVEQLRPGTSGHNLRVKVVNTKQIVRQRGRAESLVGDETGMIVFTARNEQVNVMKEGSIVDIANANIELQKGSMRLILPFDRTGSVKAAAAEAADITVNEDCNFSLIEFDSVSIVES